MSKLHELADQAEELGIEEPIAEVLQAYIDRAKAAQRACRDFRWGDPCDGGQLVHIPPPPLVLVEIGPLVSVVYEATKRGQTAHWEHDFEEQRPVLAYDDMGDDQLYIVGGDYKVTPRGIVG